MPDDPRPDILFVLSDQHAARFLGGAGNRDVRTPHLDALAASGTRFDACYCPAPLCAPSRMALLTGRYPHRTGVFSNDDILPSSIPTLAHALARTGYACHLVGRMHFNGPDQTHGFAARHLGDIGANWPGGTPPDIGALTQARGNRGPEVNGSGRGETSYLGFDRAVADHTCTLIDELAANRRRTGQPFFILAGLFCPHPPYIAAPADYDACEGRVPPPRLPTPNADPHPALAAWRAAGQVGEITPEGAMRARTAYHGMVGMVDGLAGRMFGTMAKAAPGAVRAYASDHGEALGERGLWWKSTFYDDSARVPLIVDAPGHLQPGAVRSAPCNLIDLTATLIDIAGAPPLPGMQGASLLDDSPRPTFSEYYGGLMNIDTGAVCHRMVRDGRWKLMDFGDDAPLLFDMDTDPDELHPVAGPAGGVRARLSALVREGWSPQGLSRQRTADIAQTTWLKDWVRATRPVEPARWRDPDPARNRYI